MSRPLSDCGAAGTGHNLRVENEHVVHLAGRGGQRPDPARRLPADGASWPRWRGDEPLIAPNGQSYLLAALRMTVASGRYWQRHRLVENERLHIRLAPLLGTLPLSHSFLQEPHGGRPCRFHDPSLSVWQDTDPEHWPNTLYRRLAAEDGPRPGLGEVTVALRLETRSGYTHEEQRIVSECNLRADGRLLMAQLPHQRLPDSP